MNFKVKEIAKKISKKSVIEEFLTERIKKKEIEEIKIKNLWMSIFLGLIIFLISELYIINLYNSLIYGIISFTFCFLLLSLKPILEHKKKVKKIEANLPFFLLKLVNEIKIGNNFYNALQKITNEEGIVEEEFRKIIIDMNSGKSFEESIENLNKNLKSLEVKRTLSSISNIYFHGGSEKSIKRLIDELFLKQRIASKEFSGKMVVYSLVFIAISAIVPAMFSSFILIGSYFMSISFSPIQILLIITIAFPTLDLLILSLINSKTPVFLKS